MHAICWWEPLFRVIQHQKEIRSHFSDISILSFDHFVPNLTHRYRLFDCSIVVWVEAFIWQLPE